MKKSKTEITLIWDAIHGILVREHSTNTKLDSQIEDLNDEVINLIKSDAVKDDQIDDHERRLKKQEEIIGRLMANKQEEPVCRLLADMSNLATDYMDLRVLVEGAMRDFARWMYKSLQTEYEYRNSDEYIKETCDANDYEFDNNGRIVK